MKMSGTARRHQSDANDSINTHTIYDIETVRVWRVRVDAI